MSSLLLGNSSQATINFAGSEPFGNSRGQNGDDNHCGTIRVPLAFELWACLMTLGIKYIGGNHQLFSSAQLQVNASTASKPGAQNLNPIGHSLGLQIYQ